MSIQNKNGHISSPKFKCAYAPGDRTLLFAPLAHVATQLWLSAMQQTVSCLPCRLSASAASRGRS
ncbi:hypothetical protein BN874_1100007 [Candidatus Contendobacter odensis Run_B_J11]|uniref:Uncharacterized protein n=1 Tax=Candidatus Contendobacter odensis Run_B_J11 TaxID=1400861 RepID=A0A7U7G7I1_9GAMM|nr:hypothetical protein BN874_1100007 [Candidatus Contendobacter odensis Run_B_J11]